MSETNKSAGGFKPKKSVALSGTAAGNLRPLGEVGIER